MLWHPDPPQGFSSEQGQIIIGRPIIPLIGAPQGVGELVQIEDPILALFPPIADNTFQFYAFWQVKKNQVNGIHANVPLVIIAQLGAGIFQQASGFDVRAFDSAGVPLDYEVELVEVADGDIVIWINVTTVADGEFIQLTFGKPSATDGSNGPAVWSDKLAVYHMEDTTDSLGLNDLTDNATNSNEGKIGRARGFTGTQWMTSNVTIPGDVGWISFWVDPFDVDIEQYLVNLSPNKYSTILGFQDGFFNFFSYPTGTPADTQFAATINTFQKIDVVTNGSGTTQIYKDGILIHDVTDIIDRSGSTSFFIGSSNGVDNFARATIDEVQIANVIPSDIDNRINAIYNNQNDNDLFWFKTPILENGINNFLVDDMGRVIVRELQ